VAAFFIYTDIPGSGKNWTLAVYATSRTDANEYIKCVHRKGRYIRKVTSGKVDANCGAVTDNAKLLLGGLK